MTIIPLDCSPARSIAPVYPHEKAAGQMLSGIPGSVLCDYWNGYEETPTPPPHPFYMERTEKKTSCWISAYKRLLTQWSSVSHFSFSGALWDILLYMKFSSSAKRLFVTILSTYSSDWKSVSQANIKTSSNVDTSDFLFFPFSFFTFNLNSLYHCDNCNKPHTVYKCPVSLEVFGMSLTYCILGEVTGFEWHCPTILLSFILPSNL